MSNEALSGEIARKPMKAAKIKFFTDRNTPIVPSMLIAPNESHASIHCTGHSTNSSTSSSSTSLTDSKVPALMIEEGSFNQCEQCGKVYKHRNCLSKHRWEHHESWELTRKICSTKHQQVQMLEAAQVLLEMKIDSTEKRSSF